MMAVIEAEGRTAPSSDSDPAALLKSLIAYSGKYRVEGKQWITTVDVSWNPTGRRRFEFLCRMAARED